MQINWIANICWEYYQLEGTSICAVITSIDIKITSINIEITKSHSLTVKAKDISFQQVSTQ